MRKKFLTLIVVALSLILVACSSDNTKDSESTKKDDSKEEVKTITLTHALPEDTTNQAGALAFKEYVEENSDGALKVDVYPNSQLGDDRESLEGVQDGSITATLTGSAVQVNFVDSASILDLPFAFDNVEDVMETYEDEELFGALSKEYEKKNFKLLGVRVSSFRNLTTNKEVHSPNDLQGVKLRTMESKYHLESWKSLGANPTPMPVNELYAALQQGVVDGQENPLEVIYAQKFYEQQDYVTLTKHVPHPLVWVMNKDFYEELIEELQKVVDEGMQEAKKGAQEREDELTNEIEEKFDEEGVEIIELNDDELEEFQDATEHVWDTIEEDISTEVFDAFMEKWNELND